MGYMAGTIKNNLSSAEVVIHEIGNMMMSLNFSIQKLTENAPELINNKYYIDMREDISNMIQMIISSKVKEKEEIFYKEKVNLNTQMCKIIEKYDDVCSRNNINLIYSTQTQYCKEYEHLVEVKNVCNKDDEYSEIDEDFTIMGDRCKLRRLFDNFIKNALEELCHEDNNSLYDKHIDITLVRDGNEQMIIEINNNGRTIDEDHLKNMFAPVRSKKKQGMGIGLSICDEIVKLHGGIIKAASDNISGTTFTIFLPITE